MPKPALSLVGFLDDAKAFDYLQKQCLLTDSSPQSLQKIHKEAISRLSSAVENAGSPEVIDIPAVHQEYVDAIKNNPIATTLVGLDSRGALAIQLVEIAPLLAMQIHIELDRAESFYQQPGTMPDMGEMLQKCLPLGADNIPLEISLSGNSWMVRSPSLNLRSFGGGLYVVNGANYLGAQIGPANPLVQVLKFREKAFLVNGFHRALTFGRAGAKYIPCIVQETQSLDGIALGIPLERLLSNNPPTLGHYLNDRAYPVQLRNYKKYMTVTLGENVFFEE